MPQLLIGSLLATSIALTAWRLRLLSTSGMIAAAVMGTLLFGLGGIAWASLLIAFFISSSLLSNIARKRKSGLDDKFSKNTRRDAWQVFANGGVATLFLVVTHLQREVVGCGEDCFAASGWVFLVFAGSLAAANADTWATELGVLSRSSPRLITSGRKVSPGSSGAISLSGSLAALGGSVFIAILAAIPWDGIDQPVSWQLTILLVSMSGMAGSFLDSLLGATLQAIYHCPRCNKETEKHPYHTCGSQTNRLRGWDWIDNDTVNLACTVCGAVVIWTVYMITR